MNERDEIDNLLSELTDSLKPQGDLRPLCIRAAKMISRLRAPAPSAPQPGGAVAGTERGAQQAIEKFEQLGRDLNAVHPRKHLDELVDGTLSRPVHSPAEKIEGDQS